MIEGGETTTVEFKIAVPRPVEMAERLCGMANAQGGMIIIGVEDAERKIVGVTDERTAMTKDVILRATRQIIKPVLVLNPPEPETYRIDGKQVIVATVPSNNGSVYQASGVFWVRRGTHTVPLSASELLEMAHDRELVHWELLPARGAGMADIDLDKVETYLQQRSMRSRQAGRFENMEQVLIGMACAVVLEEGKVVPTNAGVLFFGHAPQMHLMQSEVDCVLFRGATGMSRYTDKKVITGTVQELIDSAETFLRSYMPVEGRVEGWKRIDIPEYPIEALREALVNVVVHRDYSRYGESVRVFYRAINRSPRLWAPLIAPSVPGADAGSKRIPSSTRLAVGHRGVFPPQVRAQVTAIACSLPKQCQVPLSLWSRAELARRIVQDPTLPHLSVSTVGRWLKVERLRPWRSHAWQHIHDPLPFLERARPVLQASSQACALLRAGTWLVCLDEKTSSQAREGEQPPRPASPGKPLLHEARSHRRGARQLFAGLSVADGKVYGTCRQRKCFVDFQAFVQQEIIPEALRRQIHTGTFILNNGTTHAPKQLEGWLREQERASEGQLHFQILGLPPNASWLDQIEIWFSVLPRRHLQPNHFLSTKDLECSLNEFIAYHNQAAKPIKWTYTVEKLEQKLGNHL
ncbi:MAG: hypothetical protein NVSMB38_07930 [Ktedonobacteraceae bacterium]